MINYLESAASVSYAADRLRADGRAVHLVPEAATKAELMDAFAAALAFPRYFGRNLDALADCLADLPTGEPATIIWQAATIQRSEPKVYDVVVQILQTSLPRDIDVLICLG